MIKTLILDIEGTITRANGLPGKKAKELQDRLRTLENKAFTVVLCSGRGFEYIWDFKSSWNLSTNTPVIAENGCEIFDGKRPIVTFDRTNYNRDQINERLIKTKILDIAEFDNAKRYMITAYPKDFSAGREYTSKDIEEILNIVRINLTDLKITITYSSCSVDIMPEGISKLIGLKTLKQELTTLKLDECMYVGDSMNDLEIGEFIHDSGGLFCVPANALDRLKQVADYSANLEFDEGVLEILEKYNI